MWKRFLIWLAMMVFALLVMPLTFLWGFYDTFFDKAFYERDLANFSYRFATENLPHIESANTPDNITEKDLELVIKKIFNEKDFSDFFAKAFTSVETDLANVQNSEVSLHIPLDIAKGKQAVFTEEVANILYTRIPPCPGKTKPKDFECLEKGLSKVDFTAMLFRGLDIGLFSKIPSTFDVVVKVPNYFGQNALGFVKGVFYWIFVGGFLICFVLLALIGYMIREPWQMVLRYISKTILFPFVLLLIFAAALYFFPEIVGLQKIANTNTDIYLMLNFLNLFFRAFSYNLLICIVPVLVLAGCGMIYSYRRPYESQ